MTPDALRLEARPSPAQTPVPLCVDLDGTLLFVNSLYEAAAALARKNLLFLLAMPWWLLRGQDVLWDEIARRVRLNPEWLPYREGLLAWLRKQAEVRPLALVTGADQRVAQDVAVHLGIFTEVLGSARGTHLTGENKAKALAERFGEGGFDYLGDGLHDLPVWTRARRAFHIPGGERLESAVRALRPQAEAVGEPKPRIGLAAVARLLRVHQWVKNVLAFIPLVSSHHLFDRAALTAATQCFAAFCCCASAAYLLNDALDLEADRRHARKRNRPLASGRISLPFAAATATVLLAAGLGLAIALPAGATALIVLYFAATLLYSTVLKRIALMDVMALASLYCIRVLAGGAATGIPISAWTLAFFLFLFLSLALMKRYTELARMNAQAPGDEIPGRGYARSDIAFISQAGVASGLLSVLVLALYIHSPEVNQLYKRPGLLWLICPLLTWGVLSLWLASHRGEMHDDPVMFAAKSPSIWALGAIAGALLAVASL